MKRMTMNNHKKALRKLVPKARITTEKAELEAYKDIIYTDEPPMATMVVKPTSYREVSKVLAYCNGHGIAVVPWGGATNLSGSLTPDREFLALDIKGLNEVVDISSKKRSATVQAGATIEKMERALNKQGMTLGHDPWSLKSATVGGAVALDSAGNLFPKYGRAGDLVLSVKVALADGRIVSADPGTSRHPPSLFIGSSGTLGVILEVTFRIAPLPEFNEELGYAFSSFPKMFEAVKALCSEGLEPQSYIGGTLPKVAVKLQPAAEQALVRMLKIKAALFMHYEGESKAVKTHIKKANAILKKHGKKMPDRHAEEWWHNRHTYFEMNSQLADENIFLHVFDLGIPEDSILGVHKDMKELANRFNLGDRISHSLFTSPDAYTLALYLDGEEDYKTILKEFENEVIDIVHGKGGTMARTHGLGSLYGKKDILVKEIGKDGLEFFWKMKNNLDPNNILNPGIVARGSLNED